jgi:hypothetical protein
VKSKDKFIDFLLEQQPIFDQKILNSWYGPDWRDWTASIRHYDWKPDWMPHEVANAIAIMNGKTVWMPDELT